MKLCGRPFSSAKEMDEYIIQRWNEKVLKDDTVWVLGDLVSPEHFNKDVLNRLNGNIYLILGNHDYVSRDEIDSTKICLYTYSMFYFDSGLFGNKIEGHNVVMSHYPIMEWNGIEKNTIHLYGHVHNKNLPLVNEYYKDKLAFNVCMDVNDFEPKTLNELIEKRRQNTAL